MEKQPVVSFCAYHRIRRVFAVSITVAVFMLIIASSRCSATYSVLYSFGSASGDGIGPYGSLIQGISPDTNLYGTTRSGGKGAGTVFKISLTGTESILYKFTGEIPFQPSDGDEPTAALIEDSSGNFYGTTMQGNNGSTVFKVTSSGTETILHWFAGYATDGSVPQDSMIFDSNGKLWGTTQQGGSVSGGLGSIFDITTSGTEGMDYSFQGPTTDGLEPQGELCLVGGEFYGTTPGGGSSGGAGDGTVFVYDPSTGTETILHNFAGSGDGAAPYAGLTPYPSSSPTCLYGTTTSGGSAGYGTVFKISLSSPYTVTIMHSFADGSVTNDGRDPDCTPILGSDGNFHGTKYNGGQYGDGTVFTMSPTGTLSIDHSFGSSSTDGINPYAGLVQAGNGSYYGTTTGGGSHSDGTIFQL